MAPLETMAFEPVLVGGGRMNRERTLHLPWRLETPHLVFSLAAAQVRDLGPVVLVLPRPHVERGRIQGIRQEVGYQVQRCCDTENDLRFRHLPQP